MIQASRLYILLAATFLTSMVGNVAGAADTERPNILWIYLEDVSGWFSCYGDDVIKTPRIDALAADGIRFDRFYTPAGVCSATRSAIVTGMMQTSIGAHNHRSCRAEFRGKSMGDYDKNMLPESVVPLPIRFRKSGYWTFNEGGKDDYNFEWNANEFYDVLLSRGWGPTRFLKGQCLDGNWKKSNGERTLQKPFFGQLQLGGGKLGARVPKRVALESVPVPPYYPDVKEVRAEIAHHYDCLLETDLQVGAVIDELKRLNLYDNTLIFLFSDHGMKLHRHKQFLYEGGIQMPLVVAGHGIHRGGVRKDLVSGIDIAAASLAAAGLSTSGLEGQDFLSSSHQPRKHLVAARDRCDYTIEKIRAVVTPEFKYLRNYLTDRPYMQPTYKDGWDVSVKFRQMMAEGQMNDTQLIFFGNQRQPEELYDLANDPHEVHNLADDPKYAKQLREHRQMLAEWIKATGDQGQQSESDIGLKCTLRRWGEKCVNPEYDRVR